MRLEGARRRAAPAGALVREVPLDGTAGLPLALVPAQPGVDLAGWLAANRPLLRQWLDQHGGVLFRGFGDSDAAGLGGLLRAAGAEPLDYQERSSPRRELGNRVFTSTEHPAHSAIPLHCENSYQANWPALLCFLCRVPAATGGETPLADTRRIRGRLEDALVRRFAAHGVMYRRCFDGRLGLPWQAVFGTEERAEAERRCQARGLRWTWREDGALRVEAVRPLVERHPRSGAAIWFNHALFFHPSSLDADLHAALADLPSEDRPSDSLYGDGTPISAAVLEALRAAHAAETVCFRWEAGDLLILDNMLAAHGRAPFTGRREVLVAMG